MQDSPEAQRAHDLAVEREQLQAEIDARRNRCSLTLSYPRRRLKTQKARALAGLLLLQFD